MAVKRGVVEHHVGEMVEAIDRLCHAAADATVHPLDEGTRAELISAKDNLGEWITRLLMLIDIIE